MTIKVKAAYDIDPDIWRSVNDAILNFKQEYGDRSGRNDGVVYTYQTARGLYHIEIYRTKTMIVANIESPE